MIDLSEPFGFYNMDCMEGMKQFPNGFFDLAIVDPVYGGVSKGGYMFGQGGQTLAKRRDYNLALWEQPKTGKPYFDELFRVSKNQIIWGGELLCFSHTKGFSVLACMGQEAPRRRAFCGL